MGEDGEEVEEQEEEMEVGRKGKEKVSVMATGTMASKKTEQLKMMYRDEEKLLKAHVVTPYPARSDDNQLNLTSLHTFCFCRC